MKKLFVFLVLLVSLQIKSQYLVIILDEQNFIVAKTQDVPPLYETNYEPTIPRAVWVNIYKNTAIKVRGVPNPIVGYDFELYPLNQKITRGFEVYFWIDSLAGLPSLVNIQNVLNNPHYDE